MIINLRKQPNKARLMPAKSHDLGTKRRKINKTEYITINEVWGRPEKTTSVKNKANSEPEQEPIPKKIKTKHEEPQITQIQEKITVLSTDSAPVPTPEVKLEENLNLTRQDKNLKTMKQDGPSRQTGTMLSRNTESELNKNNKKQNKEKKFTKEKKMAGNCTNCAKSSWKITMKNGTKEKKKSQKKSKGQKGQKEQGTSE